MSLIAYIIFVLVIVGAWMITGHYEWQPAPFLTERINQIRKLGQKEGLIREEQAALILCIEPWKHPDDDLEKEIYMVKKSRKTIAEEAAIKVSLAPAEAIDPRQIEKAKARLENRFPGVTVYFHKAGEEDAVLYPEG